MAWFAPSNWFVPMLSNGLRAAGIAAPDGAEWSPALAASVMDFQRRQRLTADGIPGKNTWQQLGPSLGPLTADKAKTIMQAALELRANAYQLAIWAHGLDESTPTWASRNKIALLEILQQFDEWMQASGARAALWRWSWPDGRIPDGFPTYEGVTPRVEGAWIQEVGVLPLLVAAPPMLAGGVGGAAVTTAIVNTIGAAAAAAGAAWLGVKLATWATAEAPAAPDVETSSSTWVTTAPPVGAEPPPPNTPKNRWDILQNARKMAKRIGALAALLVAVTVSGFGVVATLAGAAAPLVTAAAGAAGSLVWLALAALAAFLAASRRRR